MWHGEGTCVEHPEPEYEDERDDQGIPLRYILQLELIPRLNEYSEVALGNVIVTAATEASQNLEPPEDKKGITIGRPKSHLAVFLFCLYLCFTIYVAHIVSQAMASVQVSS